MITIITVKAKCNKSLDLFWYSQNSFMIEKGVQILFIYLKFLFFLIRSFSLIVFLMYFIGDITNLRLGRQGNYWALDYIYWVWVLNQIIK